MSEVAQHHATRAARIHATAAAGTAHHQDHYYHYNSNEGKCGSNENTTMEKKKKKCDVIPHVTRAPARVGLLQAAAWGECTRQVGEASRAATHKNKKPRGGAARAPAESARRPRHWDRWSRRLRSGGELCSASDRLTGGKKSGESRRTTSAMEAPFHEDDI